MDFFVAELICNNIYVILQTELKNLHLKDTRFLGETQKIQKKKIWKARETYSLTFQFFDNKSEKFNFFPEC